MNIAKLSKYRITGTSMADEGHVVIEELLFDGVKSAKVYIENQCPGNR